MLLNIAFSRNKVDSAVVKYWIGTNIPIGIGILAKTPSDLSNVVSNAKISSERTFLLLSTAAENKNSEDLQQNLAPYWYKLNTLQQNIDHADNQPHGTCVL